MFCEYHKMAIFACLPTLMAGKKKKFVGKKFKLSTKNTVISVNQESLNAADGIMKQNSKEEPGMKPIDLTCHSTEDGLKESQFIGSQSFSSPEKRSFITHKQLSNVSLARTDSGGEAAYEGSDEHDETCSMKRIHSDLGLHDKGEVKTHGSNINYKSYDLEKKFEMDEQPNPETIAASRHLSDPGIERTAFWGSPLLKRSCSNIDTRHSNRSIKLLKSSFSYSSGNDDPGSPLSIKSSYSADHVMLKKRSLTQILPSTSGKIWWKLFLRSNRNLHNPTAPQRLASILFTPNQNDCYSSATHEPMQKPDNKKKTPIDSDQWVSLSSGSSHMDRVTAWVSSLDDCEFCPVDDDDYGDKEAEGVADFYHLDIGESSAKRHHHKSFPTGDEVVQAKSMVQSLNSFSTLANMSGIGLKIIPSITAFVNLRSVNLSGNMIAHITPGSLPKGLHTLDLSRNKLSTIEGLRDLTRLRVLNLSYNQISKTGHGLSSCTLIKDLYLAGNKISYVEGLHRLLKLAVLDLSFNKIATAKALGQLVANYNSLLAVNLLGNPVHGNVGDEQLKKTLLSLLPHLTYLNKQPLKLQRVREVASDSVAKAALGDAVNSRRKSMKRLSYSSGTLMQGRIGEGSSRSRKHRPRCKQQQSSFGRK
ncbi:hypothetical protein HPP92_018715 [Vanilla planifolia]|uniref:Uncharacterized protein n=1 Tax=Vanilla planifolia TaxID=51239 RepID=A0A835UPN0_VANPL|nr:hypothetical protein HPP92_018715 [Vanilla planifolia]